MKKEFGRRLKAARIAAGYDLQRIIADELGIERTRYLKYEHGDCFPPLDVLALICNTLNVSADYLLGLKEEPMNLRQIKKPAALADFNVEQVQVVGSDQLTPDEVAALRAFLRAAQNRN